MALRLIELVVQEKDSADVSELVKEHKVLEHRQLRMLGGDILLRILLHAKRSEAVLNLLSERYIGRDGNRLVILPLEATLPRADPQPVATPRPLSSKGEVEEDAPERIGREELYEDIKDATQMSRVYFPTVGLASGAAGAWFWCAVVVSDELDMREIGTWWEKDRAVKALGRLDLNRKQRNRKCHFNSIPITA